MKKLRSARISPLTILLLAVSAVTVLIVFVLPNFVRIFAEADFQLPLPIRIVIAVGAFAQAWRIQILVAIFAILVSVIARVRIRR